MATVRDLIADSLRSIGALASGEAPTASEAADALSSLNDLLETWNNDRLLVYTVSRSTFALTINQQSYTLGSGGDFNMARPLRIENASILWTDTSPNIEIPIEMLGDEDWQAITVKSTAGGYPLQVYPDGGFPLNTLWFWPIPTVACSVVLYTWNLISAFADVNATVSFPQGYRRALRYNLAVDLASEYGRDVPPAVARIADESKEWLRKMNWTPMLMACDQTLSGGRGSNTAYKSRGYVVD